MELTSKQRAQLRGLANTIDTIIHIGKDGIGENLVKQTDDALEARELIKGRVLENNIEYDARLAAQELAKATRSEVVQVIGTKFVLYRESHSKPREKRMRDRVETGDGIFLKIGIYGGTFNPPHLGHLTAAAAVIATLKLDKLLLIPASIPPHKDLPAGSATAEQRLEMTRMAGEQLGLGSKVETLDMEVRRAGKSFTSDTLAELKAQFPEDELWLLMGTDMFLSFETWHEPEKIASLAGIAAFGRTEADMEPQFSVQRDKLYRLYPDARIFTLTVPGVIDISSTELREQLASGTGENLLPPAVYGYILRNHLYGTDVILKSLTLSQLRPVALSYLKYKRIPHVLGTEQEAIRLATRYGADVEKARVAALLHDCTKKLDMPEQLALCRQYGIELDELEQKALKLLHAKTGAAIAREVFGVDDEIYRAIWWHTTGHADMTLLEKIIYLADYIEPSRDFPGVNDLRACVYEDLDRGMLMGLEMTIDEMTEMGNPVHHATVEARDWLKGKR